MAKLANLARMSTATTGTGTITLGSAVTGFLSFAQAGISDGQVVWYAIKDGSNTELGYGTYTSSGTTLTRNVVTSTNSNAAINLSGSAEVAITPSALALQRIESPGGRLTLTTATPVLTSTTSAQTTVYYTPYLHRFVPLYDGTSFEMHDIGGELSQATTDATKSPAACTTNSNYDVFVWLDGTTYRATRGPAWSSDTSRGTGAGTTELERVQGILLNKVAITNGPAANRGTYVGTIRTNGSSQVDFKLGAAAAGGTAGFIGLWNAYNRVECCAIVSDTGTSWTYNSTTPRAANASSGMRVSFVSGLAEDLASASYYCIATPGTSADAGLLGIGYDVTNAFSGQPGYTPKANTGSALANYATQALGFHYMSACEASNNSGFTITFFGSGSGAIFANALTFKYRM